MDFISRLPGCAGQAADAVSAYTQVEDAPTLMKKRSQNVQIFGYVCHDTNGLNHGPSMEDPVVHLERNLYGHHLAGLLWERQFERILLKYGWEKVSNWECLFVQCEKGYSYLSMWMTSNWLVRNKTLIRCGKYSIKKLIWENQHLSLIMKTWAALKDNVK